MIRRRSVRATAILALAFFWGMVACVFAQSARAGRVGLHIEAELGGPIPIPPGGSAVLTVTLHNEGPDDASLTYIATRHPAYSSGNDVYALAPVSPYPCSLQHWEGQPMTSPPNVHLRSATGSLAVGESLRCTYLLTALSQTSQTRTIYFLGYGFSDAEDDWSPANDVTEVRAVFGTSVAAHRIPAAGTLSLLALAVGIGVVGALRRW